MNSLVRILEARFGHLPADLEADLRDIMERGDLRRCVHLAVTCTSIDEFREQAQL